jgi:hypothetical protein
VTRQTWDNPYPVGSNPWKYWEEKKQQGEDVPEFDCYLSTQHGSNGQDPHAMFLVCTHPDCVLGGSTFAMYWQRQLPDKCLPETAVLIRAEHLATHRSI